MGTERDDLAREGLAIILIAARSCNRRGTSISVEDLESVGNEELATSIAIYTPDCGPWRVFLYDRLLRAMRKAVHDECRRTKESSLVGDGEIDESHRMVPVEDTLTTGAVAKLAGVSESTVRKWIRTGVLPAFRLPDSGWRRVRQSVFMAFCREYGIPVGGIEE